MSATSSSTEPVDMVVDLLDGAAVGQWTNASPDVFYLEDVPQADRGPSQDQPAHLYVWMPAGGPIEGLSGDWTSTTEQNTVEIQVWSLDRGECAVYKEDVINFLSLYANDNEENTLFHRVRPSNQDDMRGQNQARRTNHFVMTVEVDCRKLRDV